MAGSKWEKLNEKHRESKTKNCQLGRKTAEAEKFEESAEKFSWSHL